MCKNKVILFLQQKSNFLFPQEHHFDLLYPNPMTSYMVSDTYNVKKDSYRSLSFFGEGIFVTYGV